MMVWVDAQLSPAIARWITDHFQVPSAAVRDLKLRDAEDETIFEAAQRESVVVLTKDEDFVRLLEQRGSPPKIIWLTCGNTSNTRLKEILSEKLPEALRLLDTGENLVEIGER